MVAASTNPRGSGPAALLALGLLAAWGHPALLLPLGPLRVRSPRTAVAADAAAIAAAAADAEAAAEMPAPLPLPRGTLQAHTLRRWEEGGNSSRRGLSALALPATLAASLAAAVVAGANSARNIRARVAAATRSWRSSGIFSPVVPARIGPLTAIAVAAPVSPDNSAEERAEGSTNTLQAEVAALKKELMEARDAVRISQQALLTARTKLAQVWTCVEADRDNLLAEIEALKRERDGAAAAAAAAAATAAAPARPSGASVAAEALEQPAAGAGPSACTREEEVAEASALATVHEGVGASGYIAQSWAAMQANEGQHNALSFLAEGLERSASWLRAAAEAGLGTAQKNLALIHAGQVVERAEVRAAEWTQRAIELLHAEEWGAVRAEATLRRAAQRGVPEAKNNLAVLSAQRGDLQEAATMWSDLAAMGEPNAQCNLGMCYMRGLGREHDVHKAREWFQQAAAQGHGMAQHVLVQL